MTLDSVVLLWFSLMTATPFLGVSRSYLFRCEGINFITALSVPIFDLTFYFFLFVNEKKSIFLYCSVIDLPVQNERVVLEIDLLEGELIRLVWLSLLQKK